MKFKAYPSPTYGFNSLSEGVKIMAAKPTRRMSVMSTRRGAVVGKSTTVETALKYDCSANTLSAKRERVMTQSAPMVGALVCATDVANDVYPPYAPQNQESCQLAAFAC